MKERVLVIDDDDDLREILCAVLRDADYDAFEAGSGADALAKLKGIEPPGLILLDLMMPAMSGFDVRERLLADPALAGIPVVLMTASRGFDVRPLAPVSVLYKPLEADSLVRAVEEGLANRHGSTATNHL